MFMIKIYYSCDDLMTFEPYALYHDVIIVIIIFIACIIMCIILYADKSNQTYIDDDDRIRPRSDYPGQVQK